MAPVNPDTPRVAPGNYENLSKPSEVVADNTLATAVKGIGQTLGLAIEGADQTVKQVIQDQIYEATDRERGDFTNSLIHAKDAVLNGLGQALGISPPTPAEVPDGVSNGLANVATLQAANGKISSTQYWARLTNLAKDMRSQFPGYREYIDEQVSKITGHNPANAYMTSLISDLNRASAATKSDDSLGKKIDAAFVSPEVRSLPGAPAQFANWQRTGDVNAAYKWLNEQEMWQAKLKRDNVALTNARMTREAVSSATTDSAMVMGNQLVQGALDSLVITLPGAKDPIKFNEALLELQRQPGSHERLAVQLNGTLAAAEAATYAETERRLNEKIPGTNETMASRMGPDNVKKVRESMTQTFAVQKDLINNQNYGLANASRRYNEGTLNDVTRDMLADKSTNEFTLQSMLGRRLFGDTNNETLMRRFYGSLETQNYASWLHSKALDLVTQPKLQNEGQIKTFNDILQEGRTKGSIGSPTWPDGKPKSPEEKRADAQVVGDVIKNVSLITTKGVDDEGKKNIARAAFSPGNNDMIKHFLPNSENAHTTFKLFTTPAMTQEMYRLGQTDHKLWENYQDWVTVTWRNLFVNDILQMNEVGKGGVIRVGWNTERQQWSDPVLDVRKARELGVPGETMLAAAQSQIARLNSSLTNLKQVAETTKEPIAPFLIRNFTEAGINFQNIPSSLTGSMLRSLIQGNITPPEPASSGSRKTEGTTPTPRASKNNASAGSVGANRVPESASVGSVGALPFQAEDGQSVQDFMKNPTGGRKTFSRKGSTGNMEDILSIEYGPTEYTRNGQVIRTSPGFIVTPGR